MQTPGGALGYPESSLRQLNNLFGHVPDEWKGMTSVVTPGGALGYVDTTQAIRMHCEKAKDFRGVEMTATATPMKIIPGEWKGSNPIATPGMALEMLRDAGVAVEVIDN